MRILHTVTIMALCLTAARSMDSEEQKSPEIGGKPGPTSNMDNGPEEKTKCVSPVTAAKARTARLDSHEKNGVRSWKADQFIQTTTAIVKGLEKKGIRLPDELVRLIFELLDVVHPEGWQTWKWDPAIIGEDPLSAELEAGKNGQIVAWLADPEMSVLGKQTWTLFFENAYNIRVSVDCGRGVPDARISWGTEFPENYLGTERLHNYSSVIAEATRCMRKGGHFMIVIELDFEAGTVKFRTEKGIQLAQVDLGEPISKQPCHHRIHVMHREAAPEDKSRVTLVDLLECPGAASSKDDAAHAKESGSGNGDNSSNQHAEQSISEDGGNAGFTIQSEDGADNTSPEATLDLPDQEEEKHQKGPVQAEQLQSEPHSDQGMTVENDMIEPQADVPLPEAPAAVAGPQREEAGDEGCVSCCGCMNHIM